MSIILSMQTSVDTMEAKTPAAEEKKRIVHEIPCMQGMQQELEEDAQGQALRAQASSKDDTQYKVKSGDPQMEPQCTLMRPSIGLTGTEQK